MIKIRYDSNNSGGSWWLTDKNWEDLKNAGWQVDLRYNKAEKEFKSFDEAISEFERITKQDASSEGCECCGPPHNFYEV